jgi:hypothetical protein
MIWGSEASWPPELQAIAPSAEQPTKDAISRALECVTRRVHEQARDPLQLKGGKQIAILSVASAFRAASRDTMLPPVGRRICQWSAARAFGAARHRIRGWPVRHAPVILATAGKIGAPVKLMAKPIAAVWRRLRHH